MRYLPRCLRSKKKTKTMTAREAEYWVNALREFYRVAYGLDMHPLETDAAIVPPKTVVDIVQGRGKDDPTTFVGSGCDLPGVFPTT